MKCYHCGKEAEHSDVHCEYGQGLPHCDECASQCDLCDGDPLCVDFCEVKAIEYVEASTINFQKMKEAGKNFAELMSKFNAV